MKRVVFALVVLVALSAFADALFYLQIPVPPGPYFALITSLALVLAAFVALTDAGVISRLRALANGSIWLAAGMPLLLLVPYLIYSLGTGVFSMMGLLKLLAYITVPTLLLLPDLLRPARSVGWRDFGAMLALGVPVAAGWVSGIWTYPVELYFFRPLYSVCVGVYAFVVVRKLERVGYRLLPDKRDATAALVNFAGFVVIGIPVGYALHFIRFQPHTASPTAVVIQFVGLYLMVAIPEELLFRGVLQNFLERSFSPSRGPVYSVLIASVVFGASHLHHPPVPNWRYAVMATLAGVFYGNAYRLRHRTSASGLAHALVDTIWRFWF